MIKYLILIVLLNSCDENQKEFNYLRTDIARLEERVEKLEKNSKYLEEDVSSLYNFKNEISQKLKCSKSLKVGDIVVGEWGSRRRIIKVGKLYSLTSLEPDDDGSDIDVKNGVESLEKIIDYMRKNNYQSTEGCN